MKLPHWGPLQSVIWWMVLRVFDVEDVGALQLLDLRDDQNDHPLLVQRLGEAQDWIRKRRGGFLELVFSHIDTVIAIEQENTAVPKRRLFVTAFNEAEQVAAFTWHANSYGRRPSSAFNETPRCSNSGDQSSLSVRKRSTNRSDSPPNSLMRKAGSGSFKRNRSSLDDKLAVDSMKSHGIRPILVPELDVDDRFGRPC